jgi:hypothetical protein
MKKMVLFMFVIFAGVYASQRVVVAEEFTATWCTYCPGAARGLDEIYYRGYDSLAVITYHSSGSDPFYTSEAASRASYYSLTGYPTSWFDGVVSEVGGLHYGTMYPFFRQDVTSRLGVDSPLEITLVCDYDSVANSGSVTANILNTSASTVSGNLHFVIVENDIPYNWQGMSKLDFLMRDMLPNATGEAVSITASDTIIRSRTFSIGSTWGEHNCKIIVFVQASSRLIYQGAEIALIQVPEMEYYGIIPSEISGNGNGFAEPGETMDVIVLARNSGNGTYTGSANIQCTDPYITITGSTPASVSMGAGDMDTVIAFTFDISATCPDPHESSFQIDFGTSIDDIPFVITTEPGIADDIESGQGTWTHSGIRDNWHITDHKSNSPTHSWYPGVEGSWQYSDENDASLVSQYFTATPDSYFYFYQQYSLESGWDYGYVEIDNGSGLWQTLVRINGTQSSWLQASYPLSSYNGQTIRIRFRFVSDGSVHQEGWYVDDILVPTYVGINEHVADPINAVLDISVHPNPFSNKTEIRFSLGSTDRIPHASHGTGKTESIELNIYDACGRLVKDFSLPSVYALVPTEVLWDGTDKYGKKVSAGIYFIALSVDKNSIIEKVILTK